MTTITDYAQAVAALIPDPLPDRGTLAAQVARIRPGDTVIVLVQHPDDDEPVTVTGKVVEEEGYGALRVGHTVIHWGPRGGTPNLLVAVLSHEPGPATVADLDACGTYSVAEDKHGYLWPRHPSGKWGATGFVDTAKLVKDHSPLRIVHRTEPDHD